MIKTPDRKAALERATRYGAILLGLLVAAISAINLRLYSGPPKDELAWTLTLLVAGYLLYSLVRSPTVTIFFGLVCLISGIALLKYYQLQSWPGIVIMGCGLIVLYFALEANPVRRLRGQKASAGP